MISVGNKPQGPLKAEGQPPFVTGGRPRFSSRFLRIKVMASLPKSNPGAARTWPQTERWLQRCEREVGAGRAMDGRGQGEAKSAFLAGVISLQRF